MAYKEIPGSNGGGEYEERERVNLKIGVTVEGTFRRQSRPLPSRFGGEYRYVDFDSTEGRKMTFAASKIALERLDNAALVDGDQFKLIVEEATSKAGKKYALPRLYVDRGAGTPTATPPAAPKAAPEPIAATKPLSDEPPF